MSVEKIAIVNDVDEIIGYEEKMYVHEEAIKHRAFSVIVYNRQGEMLIQRRNLEKYHSPGLWTNACCSHQLEKDETILQAAKRRTVEELGIVVDGLEEMGVLSYCASFENGLTENEIDHIFKVNYDGAIPFNPEEIHEVKWIAMSDLKSWVESSPEDFTVWFKLLIEKNLF